MTDIIIDGKTFDIVLNLKREKSTFFPTSDWINQVLEVQSSIYNVSETIFEYVIKCNHSGKWFLEQLFHETDIFNVTDTKIGLNDDCWCSKSKFSYNFEDRDYMWLCTLTLIKVN